MPGAGATTVKGLAWRAAEASAFRISRVITAAHSSANQLGVCVPMAFSRARMELAAASVAAVSCSSVRLG